MTRPPECGRSKVGDAQPNRRVWKLARDTSRSPTDRPTRSVVPPSVGTATSERPGDAVLQGLSDRLGWNAVVAWQVGVNLPIRGRGADGTAAVFDGRLGHGVPTVVVVGEHAVRWGAGSTWRRALERALGSPRIPTVAEERAELRDVSDTLAASGITVRVVHVDAGSLGDSGLFRCRVELDADDDPALPTTAA